MRDLESNRSVFRANVFLILLPSLILLLATAGCADGSDSSGSTATDVSEDTTDVSEDTADVSEDTADVSEGADPIDSAPSCQDYCQGLMDKLFAPGGTQMEDLECLQQNVGTPPAFDLDCLMGAANPSYAGCLECYTGETSGEATCADLVAACL